MAALEAITTDELTNVGLSAIIARAAVLSRDPDLNKWRDVYEPAKRVIREMGLTTERYQKAIEMLTEALKI